MNPHPVKLHKEMNADDALDREIARIRDKISRRLGEDHIQYPRSVSTPPFGFIGFKERSFHEDEVWRRTSLANCFTVDLTFAFPGV